MVTGLIFGVLATIGVPVLLAGYLLAVDKLLDRIRRRQRTTRLRTLAWLLPGGLVMAVVLVYPLLVTVRESLGNSEGEGFSGLTNYIWTVTDPAQLKTLGTTALWVIVVPTVTVVLAILFSALSDKLKYERVAKLCITIPCAISMTAAAVIWSLIYLYDPPGANQRGAANALLTGLFEGQPLSWLIQPGINNLALMMIGLWSWLGFAGLLISAAIKSVLPEYLDAARLDGAGEVKMFFYIVLPQITGTLVVVITLVVSWALKVFDIIYVLTGGSYGTSVLGTSIQSQLFVNNDIGRGTALSVLLLVLTLPIGALNLWRMKREKAS